MTPTHSKPRWPPGRRYTLHFAMHVCGELDVYGMDVRDGKFHYYEDHDPGQEVRDARAQELLMLLALQQGGYVHRLAPHFAPSLAASAREQDGEEEEEEEEEGLGKLDEEKDRRGGGAVQCEVRASRLVNNGRIAPARAFSAIERRTLGTQLHPSLRSPLSLSVTPNDSVCMTMQVRECVNDCSQNGRWTNGSCACEPIYAGADCSVNLMHKAAAQLLAGLQLRYMGPMALNKQVSPRPIPCTRSPGLGAPRPTLALFALHSHSNGVAQLQTAEYRMQRSCNGRTVCLRRM